ncbi:MAG: hypothetical protein AB1656_06140 [Candidatus Omnitrophota bacterium]
MKIEKGTVGGQSILKAWESFGGDYFLALEDRGEGEYYGLFRQANNEALYLTMKEAEIKRQRMWPIKKRDLSCFSFEVEEPLEVICSYSAEEAEADGILVRLPDYAGSQGQPVYMTSNLFESGGYNDENKRKRLVESGFDLLKLPDEEDQYSDRKLRVIEQDKIWVIEDGATVTFLRPEDY